MRKLTLLLPALLLALLLGPGSPASATTMILASDEQLTDQALVVVQGTVTSANPQAKGKRPVTEIEVQVDRVLKGRVAGDLVVVRLPGGVRADGMALKIWGTPELQVSDRALLFLMPNQDGTYGVLHLTMGAFREMRVAGKSLAVRDFSEVTLIDAEGKADHGEVEMGRDFERFAGWVADRAAGKRREPDYQVESSTQGLQVAREQFTYLQNVRRRWFEFDRNVPVGWRLHEGRQPGLDSGGIPEFQQGLNAWNNDGATNIRYRYDGTTNRTTGFTDFDNVNTILFEDPNNEMPGAFNCIAPGVGSGTLAIGGPWYPSGAQPEPVPIAGADIVVNNGVGCWFTSGARAAQVYGHELGHTLGLGHSCGDGPAGPCDTSIKDEALMRATAHADNRGATLNSDDRAGILSLYAGGSGGGGGSKPATPSQLVATPVSSTQVRLNWTDNATNETNYRVEIKTTGSFQEVQQLAANANTVTLTGLTPGTTYTFRIRARNGSGFSAYSNEASATTQAALPAAPSRLTAEALSSTSVRLTWQDNATNETELVIERSSATTGATVVATPPANSTSFDVTGLSPDTAYTFRVRARNANGASQFSGRASVTTPGTGGACVAGPSTLCLSGGRFKVNVAWRTTTGTNGVGGAVPSSNESGLFWFFDAANIELIVKVLDGRGINGFYWTFYGGLSDVEYWISVTDTVTGEAVTYHNPAGNFCGRADTQSLPGSSTAAVQSIESTDDPLLISVVGQACAPGTLCLLGGRFQVEVTWTNNGTNGVGVPTALSDQSGTFWFFNAANTELVVKVIDGRPLNGKFWFFYGALSDVAYEIKVTDTTTGATKTYRNTRGNVCGQADTSAF